MNIRTVFHIIGTISFLFLGNMFIGQQCFSELPVMDFRQLSNQELLDKYSGSDISYEKSLLPLNMKEEHLHSFAQTNAQKHLTAFQKNYDLMLKLHSPEVAKYAILPPDAESYNKFDMAFLKQLEWVIETNKSSYQYMEDVEIQLSLKNISGQDVSIATYPIKTDNMILSMVLKRKVEKGKMKKIILRYQGVLESREPGLINQLPPLELHFYTLKPGEKAPTIQQMKTLNLFYDLSPGEYELTFYTRNFIGISQVAAYPKPCTIHFKIEEMKMEQKETTMPK